MGKPLILHGGLNGMKIRELVRFCWADKDFFESPDRVPDNGSRYADPTELDATAWRRSTSGVWETVLPKATELPEQGWKVHVATTLADAVKVLDLVWRYCVDRGLGFKFLRSERVLLLMNEKSFPRGMSGKFITIYPRNNGELATILTELNDILAPFSGPYILGDLRYADGPLYVRYGGFRNLRCPADGDERVFAVRRPDGTLVPDSRSASFTVPDWVELPEILAPSLAARRSQIDEDFPYRITGAIQFSNSGGVYLATDERTGARVVVREARPHAGLDDAGTDGVSRLARARWALERLAGLDCVPRLVDYRVIRDHHYLVEEYLEGQSLLQAAGGRYPLVEPAPSARDRARYAAWARMVVARVERALARLHRRGVTFGDLHPNNIIVRPDDSVAFVDFELAADVRERRRPTMAAQGFVPPAPLAGVDADRYALERVRLMTLLPLTALVERDRTKLRTLTDAATAELAPPRSTRRALRRGLADNAGHDVAAARFEDADWPAVQAGVVAGILDSATPERTDRLFPGDPAQFGRGGVDLANGAAGVLYALHRTGHAVPPEYVDWLADRVVSLADPYPGLFTGLHGVAVALDLLGRREQALLVWDRAPAPRLANLAGGLAGVALGLLHLGRPAEAVEIGDRLTDRAGPDRPGLLRGRTGIAALFLRLYEHTSDPSWLDAARGLLRQDVAQCVARAPGTRYVLDGKRHMHYLDNGSLGVAVVLSRYLRHRAEPQFDAAVAGARRACDAPFVFQSSLEQGRAGVILGLVEIGHPADDGVVRGHVRRLGWHAVNRGSGIAFPGAQLLRLSTDLFTGAAGVLLAVHAAVARDGTFLPLLESVPTAVPDVRRGRR
jgi:hypothetical protein